MINNFNEPENPIKMKIVSFQKVKYARILLVIYFPAPQARQVSIKSSDVKMLQLREIHGDFVSSRFESLEKQQRCWT